VVPLAYLTLLYATRRIGRLNFDIFQSTLGMGFLLLVLMTPAAPGCFLWCIPFLVMYQAISDRAAIVLVGLFSGLYAFSTLLVTPVQFSTGAVFEVNSIPLLAGSDGIRFASLLHTCMVAVGAVLAVRIWRES